MRPDSRCRAQVLGHRHGELAALAVRKYLDALCVYFWAATQLLLSATTFGLMALLGQPLRLGLLRFLDIRPLALPALVFQ